MPEPTLTWHRTGSESLTIFIPGWATTDRIFPSPLPDSDSLYIGSYTPKALLESLPHSLADTSYTQLHWIGFSMGCHLAGELSLRFPQTQTLSLIGFSPSYDALTLKGIRKFLRADFSGYLKAFYKACFTKQSDYLSFSSTTETLLLDDLSLPLLEEGLDFLASRAVTESILKNWSPTAVYHGDSDSIAPIKRTQTLCEAADIAFKVLPKQGHIPNFNSPELSAIYPTPHS